MKLTKEYNHQICLRIHNQDHYKLDTILKMNTMISKTNLLREAISKEINRVYDIQKSLFPESLKS